MVHKDRFVEVPMGETDDLNRNLLIESLIMELKRLKRGNSRL